MEYSDNSDNIRDSFISHRLSVNTGLLPMSSQNNTVSQIGFEFDKISNKMDAFLESFNEYIQQSRQKILDDRDRYAKSITDLNGK